MMMKMGPCELYLLVW